MSVAEPTDDRSARLHIDVTSTSKTNYTSGIQRVVRNISAEIISGSLLKNKIEAVLCFSDMDRNISSRAVISPNEIISIDRNRQDEVLNFPSNDLILMLDTSLVDHKVHRHIL